VQRTLYGIAHGNDSVVATPEPEVVFHGFGDSTLNFELKVMIPSRELYFKVQHELNMAIDMAFRAENIEIAFPQQDVHLHGLENLPMVSQSLLPMAEDGQAAPVSSTGREENASQALRQDKPAASRNSHEPPDTTQSRRAS
jgi:potassium efflux system protein